MPTDDIFLKYLTTLAERESWRVCELPPEITEPVLRVLDSRKWIEFHLWERVDPRERPGEDDDPARRVPQRMRFAMHWFSPHHQPHASGDLKIVLEMNRNDPELSPELRVTAVGKAALAELQVVDTSLDKAQRASVRVETTGTAQPVKPATLQYDIFICHASEDKAAVVVPLADELAKRELRVWVDYKELLLGDSLRKRIDEGLGCSRFGVVVLSPQFFQKQWPQLELDGLVALEMADGKKRILPLWHGVKSEDVARHSPTLAGRLAATWSEGVDKVADEIGRAVACPAAPACRPA
jgi:hypothetical protein